MKYKNIIFLVMDSLSHNNIDYLKKNLNIIDTYKDNALIFDNVFSQAPYTEAALGALLTGTNVLDYEGYLMNLKHRKYT
ncbi:sulfatase-like hydrolase/transferase, partial [Clostridium perfringens]|nr:sulfatase-like hydrolase/transferase [Clostridium perfringens]